jgi:thioredoxin reductase
VDVDRPAGCRVDHDDPRDARLIERIADRSESRAVATGAATRYDGAMANPWDVVIVGGGPAGLAAALVLGRARRRVLLCDAGPRRNAAAEEIHGFVTRDGTPPEEFRRIAREQLRAYPSVEVRDAAVAGVGGGTGGFEVEVGGRAEAARRVLLCAGMVDEVPEAWRRFWGSSVVQCPHCHGWEVRDRAWGGVVAAAEWIDFPIMLRGWTRDVTAFTDGAFEVTSDVRARLVAAGVRLEERRIARLIGDARLEAVELEGGERVRCEMLFAKPKQRQTAVVEALGLDRDEMGFVRVDGQMRTSREGVYAAGDLTTMMQSALLGAAAGSLAGFAIVRELVVELAEAGAL